MSFSGATCVLEALNVLCDASDESLRPHETKLKVTVQKLQSLIEDHGMTTIAPSCPKAIASTNGSGRAPSAAVSHGSPPNTLDISDHALASSLDQRIPPQPSPDSYTLSVAPSPVKDFVSGLSNDLEKIKEYLSQISHEAIKGRQTWKEDDPRVVDLQMAGNSAVSPTLKFRRGLSQRSLAFEFKKWAKDKYGTSEATALVESRSRKLGHVAEFLKINKDRFPNSAVARAGIEHGIKLLLCETLLRERGFSAIFCFRYTSLRSVKLKELFRLKDAIEEADAVKKLAQQQSNWLDHCQRDYDGKQL